MMAVLLQAVLMTIALTGFSSGLEMTGCGENSPLEMVENSQNYNITCTNIGGTNWTVKWDRDQGIGAGTCEEPNRCRSTTRPIALVFRPTYSTTTMTVMTTTRQLFANKVVTCYTETPTQPPVRKNEDSCVVDVVVPAELSAASVEVVKTSPNWTLRANTTITTVFSSQGRYSCLWYTEPQSGASVGSDTSPALSPNASDTSNLSNRTGWCSSSWTMPLTSGTYSYVVVASPGTTTQSAGSVSIAKPASPSLGSGCPVDYVPELSVVTCTCITSSLGSPPGVIGWSHNTSSPVLTLPNVTRSDNTKFTCNVKWSSLTQNTNMELKIAYGPDPGDTTISSADVTNGVFYTDGSRDLHLTCSTPDGAVNPAPSYSWDQPAGCRGQGQGSCTFRPLPPENVTVTCTVTNQKNSGRVQTVDRTVILNYPPPQSPDITGYITGHVLYMDDPLSLACAVTGGYPKVSNVTLKCDNHPQTLTPGQQGRLNISSLTASDNQANCTCSATWKVTSLYTRTGNVSLTVHSPPSVPSISPAQFPYLEGDMPTLTCNSSNPGVPPAAYTWSGHRSQDNVVTSPDASRLMMARLTRHDNHRIIVCNASNDYTQHRGDVTPTYHNITVYYVPILNLKSAADNNCTFRDSGHRSCVVPEGQPIRFQCNASSNPTVANITWTSLSKLTDGQGGNGKLVITSADRHAHNTEFNCTATTETSPTDHRLPLTNSTPLRVYVSYASNLKALELNNMTSNLTVNERNVTPVSLTCRSDGRPTPTMQLVRTHDGSVLKTVIGGSYTDVDDDTVVDHVISPARCEDTGTYMCVSDNQLGPEERQALNLFVNCIPRRAESPPTDLAPVNYEGRPVHLPVNMVAFPLPDNFTFVFHGPGNNMSEPVTSGRLDSSCWNTFADYAVTCNVTVNDIKSNEAGFYSLQIGNIIGHSNISFEVKYFGVDPVGPNKPNNLSVAVGGGIAAVLAVSAVIAVVIILVRRQQKGRARKPADLQAGSSNRRQCTDEEEPEMITNDLYGTAAPSERVSQEHGSGVQQPSPYEDVDLLIVKPTLLPKPKTQSLHPAASTSGNTYATVNKGKKQIPKPEEKTDVYAVVDKSKITLPTHGGSSRDIEPSVGQRADTKSKQDKLKSGGKRGKKSKKDDKQTLNSADDQAAASLYSNMTPLSMTPLQNQGTVYENYAFQREEIDSNDQKEQEDKVDMESGTVNPDGLVYTTIEFTENQQRKAEQAPPERETTEYAAINFTKTVPK